MSRWLVIALLVGCAEPDDVVMDTTWKETTPEEAGLDADALEALRAYAFEEEMHTQSVLVVRHGAIVAEWYDPSRGAGDWVTSWSIAKTFAVTLIAMALADGDIASLDAPMTTWMPEWEGTERAPITLRDVLSMTTGFAWQETIGGIQDLFNLTYADDPLAYAMDQQVMTEPGETWLYSSGNSMLLSRVIASAMGQQAAEAAAERIAEPLGFERFEWWVDGQGNTLTHCCIDATPRDFAKLGQLYLQRGRWGERQLFDEDWVDEVSRPHQEDNPSYGLHMWLNQPGGEPDRPGIPRTLYYAQGHDHQFVFVFPEQDMLVVRHAMFVRPEGDPVAPEGIINAGLMLEGIGPTGTKAPAEAWEDTTFLELAMAAVED